MDLCAESHSEPSNYLIPSFSFYLFLRFSSVFSHLYTVVRGRPVTLDLNTVLTLASKSQEYWSGTHSVPHPNLKIQILLL